MKTLFTMICVTLLALGPALAELTATVGPGYTFSANERPSVATLNLLGLPTVTISGTVDGSTGLSPGSVSGTLLSDDVPDGVYLQYNGNAPRQLTLVTASIPGDYLADLLPNGTNLGWNASSPRQLSVIPGGLIGTNTLLQTNSTTGLLELKTNAITYFTGLTNGILLTDTNGAGQIVKYTNSLALSNGAFGINYIVGTNYIINGTATYTHGLGFVPHSVRWVMVCTNADLNYAAGDEVPVESVVDFGGTWNRLAFVTMANSNTINLQRVSGSLPGVINRSTANYATINTASWRAKFYLIP